MNANEVFDQHRIVNKLDGVSFVINPLSLPQNCAAFAMVNPLAGADQNIAAWFHAHLSQTFVTILRAFSEPGSSMWIGIALFFGVLFFVWKRWWPSLVILVVAVPCGMLLNEWVKILVHRPRPFLEGQFVDWSGYSFASGHTIGATLLYGQLALFLVPAIKSRHWQRLVVLAAAFLILLVGFSRIALGAHYLTDVLAAIVFGILWLAFCLIAGKRMRRRSLPAPAAVADLALPSEAELAVVPVTVERLPIELR
jgi:membrane-associated phospholipid phosphatase